MMYIASPWWTEVGTFGCPDRDGSRARAPDMVTNCPEAGHSDVEFQIAIVAAIVALI